MKTYKNMKGLLFENVGIEWKKRVQNIVRNYRGAPVVLVNGWHAVARIVLYHSIAVDQLVAAHDRREILHDGRVADPQRV